MSEPASEPRAAARFYTGKGDDGTTGLLYGGRVRKDSPATHALGSADEAQAALGVARAEAEAGGELDTLLLGVERDLYVLMADLAAAPGSRSKLVAGTSLVTEAMVSALGERTDEVSARFEMPREFVLPGVNRCSAALDLARTVVRRAERDALAVAAEGSAALAYLNRLSSLVWAMARWQESEHLVAKDHQGLVGDG